MPTQRRSRKSSPAPTRDQVNRSKTEFGRNIRPRRGSSPTLLILNQNLPNTPNQTILLETPRGSSRVIHYQEPRHNVVYGSGQQETYIENNVRIPQLQELQIPQTQELQIIPQTYTGMQEGRRRNVYNIMYILFAVLIGIVIDFLSGSHFLRFIGVVKGSVSPFVSSIASASPFASSIGTVSPISSDW